MPRETIFTAADVPEPDPERNGPLPPGLAKPRDEEPALRPQHMNEMVGQRKVAERLAIAVDAASKRKEPLGHILLDGPPGLGKTTFATCIPRDLGVSIQIASGAALAAPPPHFPGAATTFWVLLLPRCYAARTPQRPISNPYQLCSLC